MKQLFSAFLTVALLAGCAGRAPEGSPQASAPAPAPPKLLTVGETREPATLYGFTGEGGSGGAGTPGGLVHDNLTKADPWDNHQPALAVDVPSVETGSWKINPDNTMELTWRLRPDAKWHDGAPFTSEDMMFTLMLNKDPELQSGQASSIARLMASATNPDPYTFIVRWSRIDILGYQPRSLVPMPKHLMEELYRTDKNALQNSPLFREKFVGLGPFRLVAWEPASYFEVSRFDDYYKGRPGLDRVMVRFIGDKNTMVANLLSGAIDGIMPKSLDLDIALQIKPQWESGGNLIRVESLPRITYLELMLRPEYARPVNGLPNLPVRQALYHAIDRQGISEVSTGGLGPLADSVYDPKDPLRPQLEPFITKYPYDPNRAQQLLTEAGWTRGGDGLLVHTSGERFDTEVWVNPQTAESAAHIVADNWRRVGVNAGAHEIPAARAQDRSYSAQRPGPLVTGAATTGTGIVERYDGRDFASAANQWAGRNRSGYANPRADALLDQLKSTIDPRERLPLIQEQVKIYSSDVVLMPLFWEPMAMAAAKGVKADIHPNAPTYDVYLWTRE